MLALPKAPIPQKLTATQTATRPIKKYVISVPGKSSELAKRSKRPTVISASIK